MGSEACVLRDVAYSWTMVGRKGGRLENAMLQLKNMHYPCKSASGAGRFQGTIYRSDPTFHVSQSLTYLPPV